MSRIILVLMAILGLNAGNVPAQIGDLLGNSGAVGSQAVASVSNSVSSTVSNVAGGLTGGLNIGNVTQANMLGGLTGAFSGNKPIFVSGSSIMGGSAPINVAKAGTASPRSHGNAAGLDKIMDIIKF